MKYLMMTEIENCCRAFVISGFPGSGHHRNFNIDNITENDIYKDLVDAIGQEGYSDQVLYAFTVRGDQAKAERALRRAGFICITPRPVRSWRDDDILRAWQYSYSNRNYRMLHKNRAKKR